ncbi:GerAB/ArcD/ProY family transporter [Metabacillus halosaccharovorans]|uniref:GerAB/ArcD/ProY family transporter n=1 Tax=Metabacillus halosaccharovorans TaxID=930124 RepID=UPI001C1F597A|nr:endospore germination permease [Metabacillus halosaccharovorans]MBU7592568.1 GerAB/ArcD/ProY family transporter [Metabacillus halosaccharovorans]
MSSHVDGIGVREYFSLLIILVGVKLSDTTPILMVGEVKSASWMVPIFSGIILFPFFYMSLSVVSKRVNKNLIEVTKEVFGNKLGSFISILLFFLVFFVLCLDLREYVDTIAIMYFPDTPLFVLALIFIVTCFYGSLKGLKPLGSAFYICTPYIKLAILILAILEIKDASWSNALPILGGGGKEIMIQSFNKASIFGDLFLLLLIYPSIIDKKNIKKVSFFGTTFIMFEMSFFILSYIILFGYPFLERVTFPFHEASKYVKIGNFSSHIETYFFFFWILAVTLRLSFYLFGSAVIYKATFNMKSYKPILAPISLLVLIIAMFPENPVYNSFILREFFYHTATYGLMLYSILFWLTDKVKRRGKKG